MSSFDYSFASLIQNVKVNTLIAPEHNFVQKLGEFCWTFSAQLGRHLIDSSEGCIFFAESSLACCISCVVFKFLPHDVIDVHSFKLLKALLDAVDCEYSKARNLP